MKPDYLSLYSTMVIQKPNQAKAITDKIQANRNRYEVIQSLLDIPWYVVAIIHSMECSLNFKCHLHNGDPLTQKTSHVPAGRPLTGNPPFSWQDSAIDALKMKKLDKVTDWSIPSILGILEAYNGMGYAKRGVLSPYLWSGSSNYVKGKYVADGHYDPEAISSQIGAAVLLKLIIPM